MGLFSTIAKYSVLKRVFNMLMSRRGSSTTGRRRY